MYSVVLATMLSAGSATPAFGCRGCHGCCGGCFGNAFSCYGCCGGCYGCGGGCYGCWGCGGCRGGWGVTYGVIYGSGCFGGCFGGCGGCNGGCGGFYGSSYGYLGTGYAASGGFYGGSGSCYGACYGSCSGSCYGGTPIAVPEMKNEKLPEPKKKTALERQATVVVAAPLDVRVTVEGRPTERTSVIQTFVTPELEPGRTYSYLFKAEAERDGQTVTRTRRVLLRAGDEARVDFNDLAAGKPSADEVARVTVLLPAEAKLFVDDVPCPLTSGRRNFDTPRLEPGRTYAYTLRAELLRDGQAIRETRRVIVEAGRSVTVEFRDLAVQSARR